MQTKQLLILILLGLFLSHCKNNFRITEKYDSGEIKSEITVEDTVDGVSGQYIEYHRNGQISAVGKIENEKRVGKWEYYNEDGSLKAQGNYKKGLKIQDWSYYKLEDSTSIAWEIFRKPDKFKINVPNNWTLDEIDGLQLSAYSPKENEIKSNFNVTTLDYDKQKYDLMSYSDLNMEAMIDHYSDFDPELISKQETIINNNSAIIYVIRYSENNIWTVSFAISNNVESYLIHFTINNFDNEIQLVKEIGMSFTTL